MKCLARKSALFTLLALIVSLGTGCHSVTMKQFNVNVRLSDQLLDVVEARAEKASPTKFPNIDVDIVGVSDHDFSYWSGVGMTEYWNPDANGNPSKTRASADSFPMEFGTTGALSLPKDDPIWDRWKRENVMHLFVLSSYPRSGKNETGANDTRRTIINLNADNWDKDLDHVDVLIDRDRVTLITAPKSDKP